MTKKEFVTMTKDGQTIDVSPLVVEEHKRLGWIVVEKKTEESKAPKAPAKKEETDKS